MSDSDVRYSSSLVLKWDYRSGHRDRVVSRYFEQRNQHKAASRCVVKYDINLQAKKIRKHNCIRRQWNFILNFLLPGTSGVELIIKANPVRLWKWCSVKLLVFMTCSPSTEVTGESFITKSFSEKSIPNLYTKWVNDNLGTLKTQQHKEFRGRCNAYISFLSSMGSSLNVLRGRNHSL